MTPYSLQRTKAYLAAYGADSANWPDPKRAAKALETHKEALVHEISQEDALEAWLAPKLAVPSPVPSELLAGRILKSAARERASTVPTSMKPANDRLDDRLNSRRPRIRQINVRRVTQSAAALLLVAAAAIGTAAQLRSFETEAAEWQEAALDLGVDDVYSWVMEVPENEGS